MRRYPAFVSNEPSLLLHSRVTTQVPVLSSRFAVKLPCSARRHRRTNLVSLKGVKPSLSDRESEFLIARRQGHGGPEGNCTLTVLLDREAHCCYATGPNWLRSPVMLRLSGLWAPRDLVHFRASNCYTLCSANRLLGNLLDTKYYTTRTITFVVLLCKTGASRGIRTPGKTS